MKELFAFSHNLGEYDFPILWFLLESFLILLVVVAIFTFIYDKYIQRHDQLLINYPLVIPFYTTQSSIPIISPICSLKVKSDSTS